ncbi:hypothetical protein CYMTET_25865 [Cymbomonas tetramitiformis]|uniref:NADP-dependent oxidoreductase domain-containing protein n=1 Tax=Cymbomonas tetramitiformis TaxID=36881 RepID=A0AAE0FSX8_9CHLO|nr:hypothetical protein CYMTET_25865 [Cymbomonas tetramitiformis]
MVVTVHSVAAYYDTRDGETYATVQLLDTGSADTFWTTAQQYVMADPAGTAWFDLVHWLDRRRVIDCVNQHYPLWTLAKAQEARGDPLYPALIVSTDMRRSRSYGVLFRPMAYGDVTAPRAYAMDLRASLVVFPDTHSACHLPFSDHPEQDQWLLPHYVVPPEDTVGTLPASGTLSFCHISADLAERLYHTAAPDLPLPGGYRQALSMPDGAQWEEAITGGEVQPLIDQGKIEPVEVLPDGEIATSTIFVLNKPWKPRDGLPPVQIHKARMAVAATWHWGYTQAETACTVADLPTFCLLFIMSIIFADMGVIMVYHFDVSQAFVHARLEKLANKFMKSFTYQGMHFTQSTYDPCLYYIVTSVFVAFVAVYVDDFGLTCDDAFHQAFWAAFQAAFKSKNLGRMTAVLQLAVDYDRWGIALSQTRQIKELMSKFKLPAKTFHNPMDVNLVMVQKPEHPDLTLVTPYLSLLGSLLWIARCTRPDVYYSVIYLAQFSSCPSAQAWEALQRVAQYLYFTRHYRIRYAYPSAPLSVLTIQVYSDADHARDKLNGCLSYSGGIVFLNGMVLHWVCARQTDAEMSSTGSEYVAASVVGQRAMSAIHMIVEMFGFIRITQQEPGVSALALSTAFPAADTSWMQRAATFFENHAMGHGQMGPASPLHYQEAEPVPDSSLLELPVAVMIDNQAASSILRNVMLSTKIKHVLIRFHCFRGWVCAGYLVPVYINTLLNLADIFTKPLPGLKDKVRVIISMIESFMDVIRPHPSGELGKMRHAGGHPTVAVLRAEKRRFISRGATCSSRTVKTTKCLGVSKLGEGELTVSKICLGTMTFGEGNTFDESCAILDRAAERGVTFFDSAEMYPVPQRAETQGASEKYLGRWITSSGRPRDQLQISTKVTGPSGQMLWIRDGPIALDGPSIVSSVEGSLCRLGTDYIDLLQLHWPDRYVPMFGDVDYDPANDFTSVPFEEQLEALATVVRQGKVRHVGLSNETPWGLLQFCQLANRRPSLPRIATIQNAYSLTCRTFDAALAECCHQEHVALLAYSPLAMGHLTGKYLAPDGGPPLARLNRYRGRYAEAESRYSFMRPNLVPAVQAYAELAQEYGMNPIDLALGFVLRNPLVASAVTGATNTSQVDQILDAAEAPHLSDELIAAIDHIHERFPNPSP